MHYLQYDYLSFIIEDLLIIIASVAFMIIALSLAHKESFLEYRLPLAISKISYSLYIVHVAIITIIYKVFFRENFQPLLLLI